MQYSRVLLIDDDEDDQELFLLAMKDIADQVQCITFDSARTALTQLETRSITPEVIFLDLNMPFMNGQQFLSELKKEKELSRIPVIILSTSSNMETIDEAKALGASDFITKPNSFEDLKNALIKALH